MYLPNHNYRLDYPYFNDKLTSLCRNINFLPSVNKSLIYINCKFYTYIRALVGIKRVASAN